MDKLHNFVLRRRNRYVSLPWWGHICNLICKWRNKLAYRRYDFLQSMYILEFSAIMITDHGHLSLPACTSLSNLSKFRNIYKTRHRWNILAAIPLFVSTWILSKKKSLEDPAGAALLLEKFINKLQHVTSFSQFPPIHWQIKEGACVFSCTTCELYETMKRGCWTVSPTGKRSD